MNLSLPTNPLEFRGFLADVQQEAPALVSRYQAILDAFEQWIVYELEADEAMIAAWEVEQEGRSYYEHYDPHAERMADLNLDLPEWW